jgi:hypothetical protein
MLEQLIAGQEDPMQLAQLARGRLREKIDQLERALPDPVIAALAAEGVDIDALVHNRSSAMSDMEMGSSLVLAARPSAQHGAALAATLAIPSELRDPTWQRSHTPQNPIM